MQFLNPLYLLALLAVSVPILIHLIRLRRVRRIRFSSLQFLKSMRTGALKRLRLRKRLLLALRVAAVAFLALGLAGPWIPERDGGQGAGGPAAIGMLLDNSPSMAQVDAEGAFFDQALEEASRIIASAGREDRIYLEVSNGASLHLPPLVPDAAQSRLPNLETVNRGNFLAEHLGRLASELADAPQPVRRLYLITDGQATQFHRLDGADAFGSRHAFPLSLRLAGTEREPNVAITNLEMGPAGAGDPGAIDLTAVLTNFGREDAENLMLGLETEGEIRMRTMVEIPAGESVSIPLEWVPARGERHPTGQVVLEGGGLTFDSRRYFSVRIPDPRRVALVGRGSEEESYLSAVLQAAGVGSSLRPVRTDWESALVGGEERFDAILLDGAREIPAWAHDPLLEYLEEGGGLLLLPAADGDPASYNRFLERIAAGRYDGVEGSYGSFRPIERVAPIRRGHPLFDDLFARESETLQVDLPEIYYRHRLRSGATARPVLSTAGGEPLLVEMGVGSGTLVLSAIGAGPEWSSFPVKPIFAPLFYRLTRQIAGSDRMELLEHRLGSEFRFPLERPPVGEVTLQIGPLSLLPGRTARPGGTLLTDPAREWEPGILTIVSDADPIRVAVNQDTMESDFEPLQEQELENLFGSRFSSVEVRRVENGSETGIRAAGRRGMLWHWFLLAALIFLLTESVTARLFNLDAMRKS